MHIKARCENRITPELNKIPRGSVVFFESPCRLKLKLTIFPDSCSKLIYFTKLGLGSQKQFSSVIFALLKLSLFKSRWRAKFTSTPAPFL